MRSGGVDYMLCRFSALDEDLSALPRWQAGRTSALKIGAALPPHMLQMACGVFVGPNMQVLYGLPPRC